MENKYSQADTEYFIEKMNEQHEKQIEIIMAVKKLESKIFAEVKWENSSVRTEIYLRAFNELNRKLLYIFTS